MQSLASGTWLAAYPAEALAGGEHLWAFSGAIAQAAKSAREAIRETEQAGDAGTADALTGVSRGLDKLLWMVEAHISQEPDWTPVVKRAARGC